MITEADLEVQEYNVLYNKEVIQLEQIIFNEKTQKESIILASYFYVKQLYENGLLSERELHNIKEKYHIDIE